MKKEKKQQATFKHRKKKKKKAFLTWTKLCGTRQGPTYCCEMILLCSHWCSDASLESPAALHQRWCMTQLTSIMGRVRMINGNQSSPHKCHTRAIDWSTWYSNWSFRKRNKGQEISRARHEQTTNLWFCHSNISKQP